jgi:hypothetical protein
MTRRARKVPQVLALQARFGRGDSEAPGDDEGVTR